jgi:hypothetical protein
MPAQSNHEPSASSRTDCRAPDRRNLQRRPSRSRSFDSAHVYVLRPKSTADVEDAIQDVMETEHIACGSPTLCSVVAWAVPSFMRTYYSSFFGSGLKWSITVGSFFRTDHMCPHLLHR